MSTVRLTHPSYGHVVDIEEEAVDLQRALWRTDDGGLVEVRKTIHRGDIKWQVKNVNILFADEMLGTLSNYRLLDLVSDFKEINILTYASNALESRRIRLLVDIWFSDRLLRPVFRAIEIMGLGEPRIDQDQSQPSRSRRVLGI